MTGSFETAQVGWDAYDSAGEKIGDINQVGSNYLLVTKGLFLPKDIYVPRDYVEDVSADREAVTLRVRKDQVEDMGWDEPPMDAGTMAGTAGTADTDVRGTGTGTDVRSTGRTTAEDTLTVPLREERIETERRRTEAGEVTVGKHAVEQQVDMDVPVTREEVEVTRRRVDRPAGEGDAAYAEGDTIRVPVSAEQVEVRKEPRVVEEVEISKRPVAETTHVSDTVRREEIDVDETGNVLAGSAAAASRTDLPEDDLSTRSGARRTDVDRDETLLVDEDDLR